MMLESKSYTTALTGCSPLAAVPPTLPLPLTIFPVSCSPPLGHPRLLQLGIDGGLSLSSSLGKCHPLSSTCPRCSTGVLILATHLSLAALLHASHSYSSTSTLKMWVPLMCCARFWPLVYWRACW